LKETSLMKPIYKHAAKLTALWFVFIFVLCATPGQFIPSSNWLELLNVDKLIHAFIFFVLSALSFLTAIKFKQSAFILKLCVLLCITYGVALEWMQANYFSNRSADWQDIIANSFGCLLALFFLKKIRQMCVQYSIV
jgi:VanZ family protein